MKPKRYVIPKSGHPTLLTILSLFGSLKALFKTHQEWFQLTEYLYIIGNLLLKYRLIFLSVLKVSDEPLSESNTERRVKISAGESKLPNHKI